MIDFMEARLKKRHRAERRFKWYGRLALGGSLSILVLLLGTLFWQGAGGFTQTQIKLPITFDPQAMEMEEGDTPEALSISRYMRLAQISLSERYPDVTASMQRRQLLSMVGPASGIILKQELLDNPEWLSGAHEVWMPAASKVHIAYAALQDEQGESEAINSDVAAWVKEFAAEDRLKRSFNTMFFTRGDSRQPEQAGFLGAVVGSLLTIVICLAVAFPIGVMTAVYLEEFAKKGRWSEIIEVNINNLAAVPSIVYGLLGLAVYLGLFGMPRSAPLVGGLTLSLLVLPVIIIATRAALRAVPPSIRQGALALGASPLRVAWDQTLPLAIPGIMTGTILGIARALGETAPLLMIGMVAFVADIPRGFTDPATVMPVQIFLWASSPEAGFREKTAAGILILLAVLLVLNALAIYIRKRFETRW